MDIRKKLLSIVGVLALTMSMGAGIASAQEVVSTSDGIGVTFVVACGTGNSGGGTSSATIGRSDNATDAISFDTFDPFVSGDGTVSTAANAFRISVDLYCPPTNWTVTANITDFTATTGEEVVTFPGSSFQLIGTGGWTTDGTNPAANVAVPASPVTFTGADASYTSPAIAYPSVPGAATDSSMYMDFTGQLVGLDDTIADGAYSATVTVTFNAGGTP